MTNNDLIAEFIKGKKKCGVASHLGYTDNVLINYSTELCRINRANKTAEVNSRRYSSTTSKIQTQLRFQLSQAGYVITEYIGPDAVLWNGGYQGARTLKAGDLTN